MAMKFNKLPQRLKRRAKKAVMGGTTRLRKAPEAELPIPYSKPSGIIRPDTRNLTLPNSLMEASDNRPKKTMPGPLVIVLTAIALGFILLIGWFASQMPAK